MPTGKFGDWEQARRALEGMAKKTEDASQKAMLQEGHFLRGKMVEGIREQAPGGQAFKPLSPFTLLSRKLAGFAGTKALIRTGFLRNSIGVIQKAGETFIGVSRAAKTPDGESLVNIAEVHEFGAGPYVITVTEKMRRYLARIGIHLKKETTYITIKIPARSFIRSVWNAHAKPAEVKARLEERMAKLLKGTLSK